MERDSSIWAQLVALYNKSELALCHPYTDMLLATFKPGMILIPCHHYLATINHNRSPYPLCPAAQFVFVCVYLWALECACFIHGHAWLTMRMCLYDIQNYPCPLFIFVYAWSWLMKRSWNISIDHSVSLCRKLAREKARCTEIWQGPSVILLPPLKMPILLYFQVQRHKFSQ